MNNLKKLSFIAVLLGVFHAANAQTFMTEEEMINTFPGATIGGISSQDNSTPWEQTYGQPKKGKKKGKGKGLWNNSDKYKFSWKIKKGKWCENWGSGSACWDVERINETTLQMYKKGKKLPNVWNIMKPAT